MPIYEHECQRCGRMEMFRRMSDPTPTRCPKCRSKGLMRIYNAYLHGSCDAGQEAENNGYGKFYPQAGAQFLDAKTKKIRNPAAHARSRSDMIEKLKRRGYSDISKY